MIKLIVTLFLGILALSPAGAQEPTSANTSTEPASGITVTLPADLAPDVRDRVLDALGDAGATVDAAAENESDAAGWQQAYAEELDKAVAANARLPDRLAFYWQRLGQFPGLLGVLASLGLGIVAWASLTRLSPAPPTPAEAGLPGFRSRLNAASRSLWRDLLGIAAFLAVSFAVGYAILPPDPPAARLTLAAVAGELTTAFLLIAVVRLITHPGRRAARLAPISDEDARHVWRMAVAVIILSLPLVIYRRLIVELAEDPSQAVLTVIGVEVLVTAIRIYLFWSVRAPIGALIERSFGGGEKQAPLVSGFARYWFVAYSVFALARLLAVVSNELAGIGAGDVATLSFTMLILLPFIVGGIGAWFDDRPHREEGEERAQTVSDTAKALLQGGVTVGGLVIILRSWGLDPFAGPDGNPEDLVVAALLKAAGAVVIGWALWRGVQSLLNRYAPESGEAEMEEEGFGKTGSRIDTLIPLFRSAAFAVIVVVSALTALTALGVHIGPLLAGAGVIGLAVGFGAQTLVKDVITGVFYLVEDAFRVGEYVVTDQGKGVVEKISLRSVRLRHHRGPVYTIPFGSMGTVQNHSRDWVKVKLLLRVPFDADIEKVRKLIKRVGVEMLEEPELAENIIAPVKSQGVLEVDDSAMIIGVKFICKPGEQFVVRREAYARIQKAFAENDIEFAPKRVIVESDTEELQRARAGAAAAASAHAGDAGLDAAS